MSYKLFQNIRKKKTVLKKATQSFHEASKLSDITYKTVQESYWPISYMNLDTKFYYKYFPSKCLVILHVRLCSDVQDTIKNAEKCIFQLCFCICL